MQLRRIISALFVLCAILAVVHAQSIRLKNSAPVPQGTLIQIIRAEDERRWDESLKSLLSSDDAAIRKRAALAAGRIGIEDAVPVLAEMLLTDRDAEVREMAAFALGETELAGGAFALVTVLKDPNKPARARAVEALGKITAVLASAAAAQTDGVKTEDARLETLKSAILDALSFEDSRRSNPDRLAILLGLTAVLRARPEGAGPVVVKFLDYPDPSIVATALNTMARLRLKDANERVRQLLNNGDPIVRANAARVIGAAEHKEAFEALLAKALNDSDLRVRVSAIRALGSLKDQRAVEPLTRRAQVLNWKTQSELLELFTALGNLLAEKGGDNRPKLMGDSPLLMSARGLGVVARSQGAPHPEIQIAAARINPADYLMGFGEFLHPEGDRADPFKNWRIIASAAQGLGSLASLKTDAYGGDLARHQVAAREQLKRILDDQRLPVLAVPDVMQAYARFKPTDLTEVASHWLSSTDAVVRGTAAELMGSQPPGEANTRALIDALPRALGDQGLNDAALAILGALAKQKNAAANEAIKTALNSRDHLIRRRAVALLKANGAGDFSGRIGTVQTRNKLIDYRRAIARIGKKVTATIVTSKGSFTIEFLPEVAPLTIDNFIQLARRGYFNGQTIPRVVPNFVIQAGDPRGDQNGGPGYSIRCEINEVVFERATVGMALSGKDTGGSQWFVTHSPQPHLDGGYTVFGRVVRGMDVVDSIARGDTIRRVVVNER